MSSFKSKKQKVQATRKRTKKRLKKSGDIESSASYLKRTTLYPGNRKRKRDDGDQDDDQPKLKKPGKAVLKASLQTNTSEHIRVFPSADARRAAVVNAYKRFRHNDGRQRRRVVILVATDKDARALPKALGAKQEKKKVKSPRMAVGSGKQANWEWRGFRIFSSLMSKSERKAAAAALKSGKAYTAVLPVGEQIWRVQEVFSDRKTKLLLQEGPFPKAEAYVARIRAIEASISRAYFLAPRRRTVGKGPAVGDKEKEKEPHPLAATGTTKDAKTLALRLESQGRKPTASHVAVCTGEGE